MLVKEEVNKRIDSLYSYIHDLSDHLQLDNLSKSKLIIKENKNKINHTLLSKYQPQNQQLDILEFNNAKLIEQVEKLVSERDKKLKQVQLTKRGYQRGIREYPLKVSLIRIKITIDDSNKIYYDQAILNTNFQQLQITFHGETISIPFDNIETIQRKSQYILIEYYLDKTHFYLMLQLETHEKASKLSKGLTFAKMIRNNFNKRKLFVTKDGSIESVKKSGIDDLTKFQQVQDNKEESSKLYNDSDNSKNIQSLHKYHSYRRITQNTPNVISNNLVNHLSQSTANNRFRGNTYNSQLNVPKNGFRKGSWDLNLRKNSTMTARDNYPIRDSRISEMKQQNSSIEQQDKNIYLSPKIEDKVKLKEKLLEEAGKIRNRQPSFISKEIIYIEEGKDNNKQKVENKSEGSQNSDEYGGIIINGVFQRSITDSPLIGYNNFLEFPNFHKKQYIGDSYQISQKEESFSISSPKLPPKSNSSFQADDSKDIIKLVPIDKKHIKTVPNRIGEDNSREEDDDVEQQEDYQDNKSQSDDNNSMNESEQQRLNKLRKGIIVTKCAADGLSPHEKRLYLSQNDTQLNYQDMDSNKLKSVNILDIEEVIYKKKDKGILKHRPKVDDDKCMIIKLKPIKSNNNKPKTLEFVGQISSIVQQFAKDLKNYIQSLKNTH